MFDEAEDHRLLEQDVRQALSGDGLALAYQPIIDASTGDVVGREALLRWRHPKRGDIPPDQFIPIIEDAGLIHQIGDWVIREACAEAARGMAQMRVAVNISAAQLTGAGLAKTVLGALASTRLHPSRLELEVTESVFLGDDAATLASLERLRALGVRLVLDDFGKGYSSFGYLSRAHFAKIKIDQSFVRGAAEGTRTASPSSTPSSRWPAAWALKPPPKGWRRRPRPTSCASSAAPSFRASISAGRPGRELQLASAAARRRTA